MLHCRPKAVYRLRPFDVFGLPSQSRIILAPLRFRVVVKNSTINQLVTYSNRARRDQRVISTILSHPEAEWIEFKRNNADAQQIGENVSALSNAARLHQLLNCVARHLRFDQGTDDQTSRQGQHVPPTRKIFAILGLTSKLFVCNVLYYQHTVAPCANHITIT